MHSSGILILTTHISQLCTRDVINQILSKASQVVRSNLYVHLENASVLQRLAPNSNNHDRENYNGALLNLKNKSMCVQPQPNNGSHCSSDIFTFLSKFYSQAFHQCKHLNVSILTHNLEYSAFLKTNHYLRCPIQCVLSDIPSDVLENLDGEACLQNFVNAAYTWKSQLPNTVPEVLSIGELQFSGRNNPTINSSIEDKRTESCVLGGTFDHIHPGHKVMLSEATILVKRRLLVGVTDGSMLNHKLISEMIKPWEKRFSQLQDYLLDIGDFKLNESSEASDSPLLEIVRITDAFGPSVTDPDLDCIIVSQETKRGGDKVNEVRVQNGLKELHVHVISDGELIQDESAPDTNESKVSSSTLRYDTLGTLLKPAQHSPLSEYGYVIGLTGSIASGKSSIARRLQNLGANIVDCDKLGHQAYVPGTATFEKVVERFGGDIVGSDGSIDRGRLAAKVFTGDKKSENLSALNSIVWPAIEELAKQVISQNANGGAAVHVLEAAVLLEAGWERMANEVWLVTVPEKESIKRVMERDGRSEEEATKRLKSQMSSKDKAKYANVVLSTLWEPQITQKQVEKAWHELSKRLPK